MLQALIVLRETECSDVFFFATAVFSGAAVFVFRRMKKSGLGQGRFTPYFFNRLVSIAKLVESD